VKAACFAIKRGWPRRRCDRLDPRSFEARGIDREATEHLGPTAAEMERDGEPSERGERNREIEEANRKMDELVGELAALDAEIAAEEQRLLEDRFGPSEEIEQDTPDPAGATDGGEREDRILSDEEKREARSAFEPDAAAPDVESDRGPSDEEKLQARDSIKDAETTDRRIGTGQFWHFGLGMPWWQRVAVFMTRLGEHVVEHVIEPAVEAVQDAWQRFTERQHDIDRDDGPGFDR
jgi:hypothetical protein